ncbi:coiled-coil domain-containing protein 154 [Erinaceus europaeus]|uniref:Coiled-coil domain-containing protein 154 n=1 Tax=Erinaceus europaeus TaxID=9365 RepID=A0ABM3W0I8_ERIEU|nr:coiled-coil domain-containing protein 154 [Erinaceus europaeus]
MAEPVDRLLFPESGSTVPSCGQLALEVSGPRLVCSYIGAGSSVEPAVSQAGLPLAPRLLSPQVLCCWPWAPLADLADSSLSSGASPPSPPSPVALEDLQLLLRGALDLGELSEHYESSQAESTPSVPEQDTPGRWGQLEQRVAGLQGEVASLQAHKERCERAVLSLLRELLQVHAHLQLQDSELRKLQREAVPGPGPGEEARELPGPQAQSQMQILDRRLVEVREALGHIRKKQAVQASERKAAEHEAKLSLAKLLERLEQEEQQREAACSALQRGQEEASQRVDHEVARMQAQVSKLGEEMSLRFLRREAKLCGFLQKSFLTLEKRMKASEGWRLTLERGLREELDTRWQRLEEMDRERQQALQGHSKQEQRGLVMQCQDLDKAVIRLTTFVQQNQVSLNRILVAQQKARDAEGAMEESQAEEVAACLQEGLETMRQAGELAQREMQQELGLLREKSQALEVSVAELVRQVKDLGDHFLALSWRLGLQEQTLDLRLREARSEWEDMEHRSQEDLARCRREAEGQLKDMQEVLRSLSRQIEAVSDKCIFHKSDSDLKISEEGRARDQALGALRQELAALLASVQLLKEDQPGRRIAEMQGKLATFQNQIMRLENSMQDHKAIQNLKFNTESKLRMEEMAALREGVVSLWSGVGPWALMQGSKRVPQPLAGQQLFIKDSGPQELVSVNCWGVYQAVRWLQWKAVLLSLLARRRLRAALKMPPGWEPACHLAPLPLAQK